MKKRYSGKRGYAGKKPGPRNERELTSQVSAVGRRKREKKGAPHVLLTESRSGREDREGEKMAGVKGGGGGGGGKRAETISKTVHKVRAKGKKKSLVRGGQVTVSRAMSRTGCVCRGRSSGMETHRGSGKSVGKKTALLNDGGDFENWLPTQKERLLSRCTP